MPFADLHCDTISRLHQRRRAGETLGLRDGQRMHINLEKLKRSGYALQNFALSLWTWRKPRTPGGLC